MTRLPAVLSIFLVFSTTLAWAQNKPATKDAPPPAAFKIAEVTNRADAPANMLTYAAGFGSGETQPRFLIEIDGEGTRGKVDGKADADADFFFYKGRFRHAVGSHPGPFLAEVAKALGAKAPKMSQAKAEVLPFELAILGTRMSRDPGGGFSGKPSGDWVATKLFLADGKAEVYFNFEIRSGDAEFSPKDEEYGNLVVEELSKVLW